MIRPDTAKWGQEVADLRHLALQAAHVRTRERFQALYMIASQQKNASQWAYEIGRQVETVLKGVHTYNARGPDALVYQRTGGRRPLFRARPSAK